MFSTDSSDKSKLILILITKVFDVLINEKKKLTVFLKQILIRNEFKKVHMTQKLL